jgi:hypothetical protein
MIFFIGPVTGETAEDPAVRTAFFPENRSPEDFYPIEVIVTYRTVD